MSDVSRVFGKAACPRVAASPGETEPPWHGAVNSETTAAGGSPGGRGNILPNQSDLRRYTPVNAQITTNGMLHTPINPCS